MICLSHSVYNSKINVEMMNQYYVITHIYLSRFSIPTVYFEKKREKKGKLRKTLRLWVLLIKPLFAKN